MAKPVKAIPEGYHTLTPYLTIKGCSKAIEFYKRAFGAEEISRMGDPSGPVAHAELKIGDSRLMMGDEFPEGNKSPVQLGGTPVGIMIYVENVDAAWKRAVEAGATVKMPLATMFWGDRYGKLADPFGHEWSLGQHVEDVPPEEMETRFKAAMASMAPPKKA